MVSREKWESSLLSKHNDGSPYKQRQMDFSRLSLHDYIDIFTTPNPLKRKTQK